MTGHALLPRVGVRQLANHLKDSNNNLISTVICAITACPSSAPVLIVGRTGPVHTETKSRDTHAAQTFLFGSLSAAKMSLGLHRGSALPTAPPASSSAQRHLPPPLEQVKLLHRASECSRGALHRSHHLEGLLGQHTPRVAAACSANAMRAVATQAGAGAEWASISAGRGRLYSAASSSGRIADRWSSPICHGGASSSRVGSAATASTSSRSSSLDTGLSTTARCSSSSSYSAGSGGSVTRDSSVGPACRSLSGGGVLAAGGWERRGAGRGLGRAGSDGRCFSAGAWGPGGRGGGGGGGSSSDDGSGLPPPIIISPVAIRVVVIGWMGSNRRYLNKYGSLWARSGDHEVLIIRPTVAQTLVRWRGVVVAGRDIDRVARMHRENPAMPTVYHVFSTGGFIHAGTMWRWMDEVEDVAQRRDLLEEVRGIILDSAPAAVNPEMSARAIVSAVTNTPAEDLSYGMPGVQGMLLDGTRAFMGRYLQSKGVKLRTEEVYDAWYNLAPVCPQLYLYSDADPLVPASDVEKYMGVQESRGVEVSGYKWPDSGHVEHFRRHPHEYAYQISAFLARALRDW
ncbi:hypothetical protein PLESTB_000025400 [Pleodorina starrii]|uniref:Uncharacterized protein n=1 Tax=Pleodorina starrii TaxID=330485 RepID=A0A9W6B9K1_9CHLO|nr:hypothetical protein PLESTM_001109200 [Pleodorina starrii]GLC47785.1 hypothetical protein PLESTB_000025400 [Pleodorina starrii]